MRSAQGGAHEVGGRHISGAERIVSQDMVEQTTNAMLERAFSHTRGKADFINIVVEKIQENKVQEVPLLSVQTVSVCDVPVGRHTAQSVLAQAGVTSLAAQIGMTALLSLADSMGGAMLLCAVTGRRLDDTGSRGVRVSRMDIADEQGVTALLADRGINNTHVREALVLASKVAAAPGMVAELCWSDDPEYTTGYVASPAGYVRIPHCKPLGSLLGGRVFFVKPDVDIDIVKDYLSHQPVLVGLTYR
ncbi:MAG: 6-carboxyhexanoate--CoA ligase [Firmicutes bacterium]|nr:6-carboxyhexanoate--CoA ligase [Bacillota bacterium]